ncbi:MAG: hypothetical protein IJ804_06865 [Prevotella sp.]|nr:hypothetical protein [Prevotella sp.]
MVPATEVVDMEVQLMVQAVSMGGDSNTTSAPTWDDNASPEDASNGW